MWAIKRCFIPRVSSAAATHQWMINYWDPRKRGGNWEERDKGEARESIHKVPCSPAVLGISLSRNAQWTRCTLATQIPSFWSPKTKELYWSSKCETSYCKQKVSGEDTCPEQKQNLLPRGPATETPRCFWFHWLHFFVLILFCCVLRQTRDASWTDHVLIPFLEYPKCLDSFSHWGKKRRKMESGLSQSSLSNEPLAVPGKSIPSNSFLSSSQAGFPLQDRGRARKGSVALVDDHCRCNFFFFFLPFWSECFSILFYGAPKASIHIAFRFSKNEFAVLDTKRPREPGVALALDPHP